MTQQTLPVIVQAPAAPRGITAGGILVGGLLLGGLGWLIYKKVDSHFKVKRRKRFTKGASDSLEKQQAIDLYNAMDGGGTNEETIFSIAKQIKDWDKVTEEYNAMLDNKGDILADLHGDLNSSEMQKFWDIIRLNKNKNTPLVSTQVDVRAGKFVLAKANVNVRKTPVKIGPSTITNALTLINPVVAMLAPKSNIILTAPKDRLIGILTGRTEVDEKSTPAILFLEVLTFTADTKREIRVWVAASQVESITKEEKDRRKPSPVFISQAQYNTASSSL